VYLGLSRRRKTRSPAVAKGDEVCSRADIGATTPRHGIWSFTCNFATLDHAFRTRPAVVVYEAVTSESVSPLILNALAARDVLLLWLKCLVCASVSVCSQTYLRFSIQFSRLSPVRAQPFPPSLPDFVSRRTRLALPSHHSGTLC